MQLDSLDDRRLGRVAAKSGRDHRSSWQQSRDAFVPAKQQDTGYCRHHVIVTVSSQHQISFEYFSGGIILDARPVKCSAFKAAHETPQMRLVYVGQRRPQGRYVFVEERQGIIKQGRQFFRGCFAFVRADAYEEASVAGSIRTPLAIDVERHDAPAVVESDAIDEGNDRRHNLFATDAYQFILDVLAVFDAFDAQLIVDAEHDHSAAGVGHGDDLLGDALGVGKFYFEFKEGIFTAAHQTH